MNMQPYKIAIVGGIGSGKSVVSKLFRLMGIPVYDCDTEAKRLMNTDSALRSALIAAIDERVYGNDGSINRAYLSAYMFGNNERVARVNNIVHPAVRTDFKRWATQVNCSVVAVETAILYESGMNADVDTIVMVHTPIDMRISRVIQRDNTSEQAIRRRMSNQMSDTEIMQQANQIIYNDGCHSLIAQVKRILQGINSK